MIHCNFDKNYTLKPQSLNFTKLLVNPNILVQLFSLRVDESWYLVVVGTIDCFDYEQGQTDQYFGF
jgi:hypothetical protein